MYNSSDGDCHPLQPRSKAWNHGYSFFRRHIQAIVWCCKPNYPPVIASNQTWKWTISSLSNFVDDLPIKIQTSIFSSGISHTNLYSVREFPIQTCISLHLHSLLKSTHVHLRPLQPSTTSFRFRPPGASPVFNIQVSSGIKNKKKSDMNVAKPMPQS